MRGPTGAFGLGGQQTSTVGPACVSVCGWLCSVLEPSCVFHSIGRGPTDRQWLVLLGKEGENQRTIHGEGVLSPP